MGAQRVVQVGAIRPGRAVALEGQLHAPPQVGIGFVHGVHGRVGIRVCRGDQQPFDVVAGRDVVQCGASSIGQHHGLGCLIDALTHQQLGVGIHLDLLVRRI